MKKENIFIADINIYTKETGHKLYHKDSIIVKLKNNWYIDISVINSNIDGIVFYLRSCLKKKDFGKKDYHHFTSK